MSPLLSVVVPTKNTGIAGCEEIDRIIEFVSDLTPHFELLLVPDAANDNCLDVIREHVRRFPQVRLVMVSPETNYEQQALEQARGETVILVERGAVISPGRLRQLWELHREDEIVIARLVPPGSAKSPVWLTSLLQWGQKLREAQSNSGLQIVRKSELECAKRDDERQTVLKYRQDGPHERPPGPGCGNFLRHLQSLSVS